MATFGYASIGATSAAVTPNYVNGNKWRLTELATVTKMSAYMSNVGGSQPIRLSIYKDNAGAPGAFVAASSEVTVAGAAGWVDFPLSTVLESGDYWLCYWNGTGTQNALYYYDAGLTIDYAVDTYSTAGNPSSPFPTPSTAANHQVSIYVTYTPITTGYIGNPLLAASGTGLTGNGAGYVVLTGSKSTNQTGFVLSSAQTIDRLRVYGFMSSGGSFVPCVYDNTGTGGLPGNLIATGPGVSPPLTLAAAAWFDAPLSAPLSLPAGTYWIGFLALTQNMNMLIYPGATNSYARSYRGTTSTPYNPMGSLTNHDGNYYAIYAPFVSGTTYTDSGSGSVTLDGTSTESLTHSDSGAGSLTLAGTGTSVYSHIGSGAGTVTLGGSSTSTVTYTDARAGTLTLSGSGTPAPVLLGYARSIQFTRFGIY